MTSAPRTKRADAAHGGIRRNSPLTRACPTCGVGAGHACRRRITGRYIGTVGEDASYTVPMTTVHAARKAKRDQSE
jgi:hypothetical protein